MMKKMLDEEMLKKVNGGCYDEEPMEPAGDPKDAPIYRELGNLFKEPDYGVITGAKKLLDDDVLDGVNGGANVDDIIDREAVKKAIKLLPNLVPDTETYGAKKTDISDLVMRTPASVKPGTLEVKVNSERPNLVL